MKHLRWFLFVAILLSYTVAPAAAERRARAPRGPLIALQPIESVHGTALVTRAGGATVDSAGRRVRVGLRRSERLVEIAETRSGWVAAGFDETPKGVHLVVIEGRDDRGHDRLPAPARGGGLHRATPRALIQRGELAGLAWLEGSRPDRLAIRAAEWNGAAWTDSVVVAAAGPGSQTGLAQAVLPDGSWLLVWSRFDGRENELYWSLRSGGNWTPALPLEKADGVPDVTPTLVATADGALLAWSEYDGRDYRLRGARFTAGGWRPVELDAGRGSLQPKFRRQAGATRLLFRTAVPRGWAALEITGDGVPGRLARVETATAQRPLLRPDRGGGLVFEWPGERPESVGWERRR